MKRTDFLISLLIGVVWGISSQLIFFLSQITIPFLPSIIPYLTVLPTNLTIVTFKLIIPHGPASGEGIGWISWFLGFFSSPFYAALIVYLIVTLNNLLSVKIKRKREFFLLLLIIIFASFFFDSIIKQPIYKNEKIILAKATIPNSTNLISQGTIDEGCTPSYDFCRVMGYVLYKGSFSDIRSAKQTMDQITKNLGKECNFLETTEADLNNHSTSTFLAIKNLGFILNSCMNNTIQPFAESKNSNLFETASFPSPTKMIFTKVKEAINDNEFIFGILIYKKYADLSFPFNLSLGN